MQMVVQLELSLEKQEPVGKAVPRKSNKILNLDQITNNWRVVQCVLMYMFGNNTLIYLLQGELIRLLVRGCVRGAMP